MPHPRPTESENLGWGPTLYFFVFQRLQVILMPTLIGEQLTKARHTEVSSLVPQTLGMRQPFVSFLFGSSHLFAIFCLLLFKFYFQLHIP